MITSLSRIARHFSVVPLASRRTTDLNELMRQINWRGVPVRRFGSLKGAYNHVAKNALADDIIVIVGSHFLVGEFIQKFKVV